jgi:hypothetical protein
MFERMLLHHLVNCFRCVCVCVCVSLSLFLALSLTTIFPPSSIPCLNLLNNVGFDVCWLLWFFMPLMSWMRIYILVHESVGEGDQRHLVIERCEDSIMYVFSLCLLSVYWHHGWVFLLLKKMWQTFVMQIFCNHFPWVLSRLVICLSTPMIGGWWNQWGVMAASNCPAW